MAARIGGVGLALAAAGVAHFVKPEAFEGITASAFPDNTRRHTYINGGIETALGVGLITPRTRRLAAAGAAAYVGYLVLNAVRARR